MDLTGFHHLTAISAQIRENYRFYTQALGMRLVKRSVNQDDVSAYHLFYADGEASPGTDITFFDWPVPPERRGTNAIIRTSLRVNGQDSLEWWARRLRENNLKVGEIGERGGRLSLDFEDPEGQRLSLVDDNGQGEAHSWERSPVPAACQIRGLGPILLSVQELRPTAMLLEEAMFMRKTGEYASPEDARSTVHIFAMGPGGPAAELHVVEQRGMPPARQGAGGVHHVAFRTPTYETHSAWIERIQGMGIPNSGLVDRYYFRSLYFREPNGILFEIASDGPGFAVDEDADHLGERVALPPFLESRREQIVSRLKPID